MLTPEDTTPGKEGEGEFFCEWHSRFPGMKYMHTTENCKFAHKSEKFCHEFNAGRECAGTEGTEVCEKLHQCYRCEVEDHGIKDCPVVHEKQYCDRFNKKKVCKFQPNCVRLHQCKKCDAAEHGYSDCPKKPPCSKIHCDVCDIDLVGTEACHKDHFVGKIHKKKLAQAEARANYEGEILARCDLCDLDLAQNPMEQTAHFEGRRHKKVVNQQKVKDRCEICNITLALSEVERKAHYEGKRHKKQLKKRDMEQDTDTKSTDQISTEKSEHFCAVCKLNLALSEIEQKAHYAGKRHLKAQMKKEAEAAGLTYCEACKLDVGWQKNCSGCSL